jgi:hypothetical protein
VAPEIVVTTPVPEESPESVAAKPAGSSSSASWAVALIFFLLGGFAGRISWRLFPRRKKQQIFG